MTVDWALVFREMAAALLDQGTSSEKSERQSAAVIREVTRIGGDLENISFQVRYTNSRTGTDVTERFESLTDLSAVYGATDGEQLAWALMVEFDEQVLSSPPDRNALDR